MMVMGEGKCLIVVYFKRFGQFVKLDKIFVDDVVECVWYGLFFWDELVMVYGVMDNSKG